MGGVIHFGYAGGEAGHATKESECGQVSYSAAQRAGSVGSPRPALVTDSFLLSSGLCLGQVTHAQTGESRSLLWVQPAGGSRSAQEGAPFGRCPLGGSASLPGALPKPSLQALPSSLVPLGKLVTVRCQGPPDVDLYRLEELRSGKYFDQAVLSIPVMEQRFAGRYRCSYQNGTLWSPASNTLELVATGNRGVGRVWLDV